VSVSRALSHDRVSLPYVSRRAARRELNEERRIARIPTRPVGAERADRAPFVAVGLKPTCTVLLGLAERASATNARDQNFCPSHGVSIVTAPRLTL